MNIMSLRGLITMKNSSILILGGDERSLRLGDYLEAKGLNVCYYGFADITCFESLAQALEGKRCVILPLPFTRDRETLNTPLSDEKIKLADIAAQADKNTYIFGGQLTGCFSEALRLRSIKYYDYFTSEELALYNAVPTAEGVAGILINELPLTVHGMKCCITGYGRIGKATGRLLKAMGAEVTAAVRSPRSFAEAHSAGIMPINYNTLREKEQGFDALINTVPAKVLTKAELKNLKSDCVLIETASAPFGIDFQAAKELALTVIKANSLPGKVAPKTAGEIIGQCIMPLILKEEAR